MVRFRKSPSGYASTKWVTQVPDGLRKYPTGYANAKRVAQPAILLCLFQVIVQQNRIHYKFFQAIYQWHILVVTVSDW